MPEQPKTWKERIVEELCRDQPTAGEVDCALDCALEAYAEMRCVRLKVLLARCYELMSTSKASAEPVNADGGFFDEVLAASK